MDVFSFKDNLIEQVQYERLLDTNCSCSKYAVLPSHRPLRPSLPSLLPLR